MNMKGIGTRVMMQNAKLELLDFVDDLYQTLDLHGIYLVACQNLFGSTAELIERLIKKGLKPINIFVLGKVYTASAAVVNRLRTRGVYVAPDSFSFDPSEMYDAQFENYVQRFIEDVAIRIGGSKPKKIIFLDEGGQLLKYADRLMKDSDCVAVEQSTPVNHLDAMGLKFPYISIARSFAKLSVETPLISESIVSRLQDRFDLTNKSILVVGQGPLGRQIKSDLAKLNFQVAGYDRNSEKSDILSSHKGDFFQNFDIVIGCNYNQSVGEEKISQLPKDTILVNAALSDRSFPASFLRKNGDYEVKNCHEDVISQGGILLLNCGFPLNFDGGLHSVPPGKIQITRALLLVSIYHLLTCPNASHQLEDSIQNTIVERFNRLYPEDGLNLVEPNFAIQGT